MKTNLLELITKDKEQISSYLADVATEDFIEDVKNLAKSAADKEAIKLAIKSLQNLL